MSLVASSEMADCVEYIERWWKCGTVRGSCQHFDSTSTAVAARMPEGRLITPHQYRGGEEYGEEEPLILRSYGSKYSYGWIEINQI